MRVPLLAALLAALGACGSSGRLLQHSTPKLALEGIEFRNSTPLPGRNFEVQVQTTSGEPTIGATRFVIFRDRNGDGIDQENERGVSTDAEPAYGTSFLTLLIDGPDSLQDAWIRASIRTTDGRTVVGRWPLKRR